MRKLIAILSAAVWIAPLSAQTFSVSLGGKSLGQLSFSQQGTKTTLRSTLDSTPMGVFNGTFVGTSTGSTADALFVGDSQSSRKRRVVSVEIAKGFAVSTAIQPATETTDLSDVARVPAPVIDPVRAIATLLTARGCSGAMQMYDGRRVVTFSPSGTFSKGNTLTCKMNYHVTAGPGHLSPLRISSAKLQLSYDTLGGGQSLKQLKVSSGIFRLSLDRIK